MAPGAGLAAASPVVPVAAFLAALGVVFPVAGSPAALVATVVALAVLEAAWQRPNLETIT